MSLPFTLEQLLQVFEDYNLAIWPMQVAALILGLTAVYLAIRPSKNSNRLSLSPCMPSAENIYARELP